MSSTHFEYFHLDVDSKELAGSEGQIGNVSLSAFKKKGTFVPSKESYLAGQQILICE